MHGYSATTLIAIAGVPSPFPEQSLNRVVTRPSHHCEADSATPSEALSKSSPQVCLMQFPGSNQTWILKIQEQ